MLLLMTVLTDNKITMLGSGGYFSIALATDGTVYAWGLNSEGQLGDNSTTNRSTPVKVLDGAYSGTTYLGDDSDNKITAVTAGYFHSASDTPLASFEGSLPGHLRTQDQ